MKQTKTLTIPEIQRIVMDVAIKYDVDHVFLFGSYAKGEETPTSDVDLRINMQSHKGLEFWAFWQDLEDSFGLSVDLIETQEMPDYLKNQTTKDEVLLYDIAPLKRNT